MNLLIISRELALRKRLLFELQKCSKRDLLIFLLSYTIPIRSKSYSFSSCSINTSKITEEISSATWKILSCHFHLHLRDCTETLNVMMISKVPLERNYFSLCFFTTKITLYSAYSQFRGHSHRKNAVLL